MALCLSRKLLATAVLAALSLPGWAQSDAAAPTAATAAAPAAVSAPATEAAKPTARPGPRAQRGEPGYQRQRHHYRHQRAMRADQLATGWQERRAQHHAQLKEQLRLTPTQEAAWTEFTAAMEPARHARLGWEGMEQLTTPERVDRMRALRLQHAAEADRRGEAVKAFYAQLNPEQQKTFDAHHRGGPHRMAGGPGGRGMMPAAADGMGQPGWKHPDCMMDGTGPRDGRGPRGPRAATPSTTP